MPCVLVVNSGRIRGGALSIHVENRDNSLNDVSLRSFVGEVAKRISSGIV